MDVNSAPAANTLSTGGRPGAQAQRLRQAKAGLALGLGVPESTIEIIVKF
jgi:hypothetical protein